jgi:hypothetical protein
LRHTMSLLLSPLKSATKATDQLGSVMMSPPSGSWCRSSTRPPFSRHAVALVTRSALSSLLKSPTWVITTSHRA